MDMTSTLAPKSNQLNTDDLIAGPLTITITKVTAGNAEQPVAVHFQGDDGKPWYPCKSMRRVLVAAWGVDASQYSGRRVTLFRDPEVMYGGIKVGGIRISHLSELDCPLSIALTVTRQKRAPYRVDPLAALAEEAPQAKVLEAAEAAIQRVGLTDFGKATLIYQFTKGKGATLGDIRTDWLQNLPQAISGEDAPARLNAGQHSKTGEQLLMPPDMPELPATWDVPEAVGAK